MRDHGSIGLPLGMGFLDGFFGFCVFLAFDFFVGFFLFCFGFARGEQVTDAQDFVFDLGFHFIFLV